MNMKKILFISNIPAPYRIDFYNELGKYMDVTVLFEARGASDQGIKFNYNIEKIKNFRAVFLSDGDIRENRINWKIINFFKNNHYDKVVVTSYSYFTEMVAIMFFKVTNKQYYMEVDGGIIRTNEKWIKYQLKKFLISGAAGYFSPSKATDEYLKYYGAKPSRIQRYPFTSLSKNDLIKAQMADVSEKVRLRKKIGISERIMVLYVGQFIFRKGIDILLETSLKLPNDCGVYLVGSTPNKEYIEMVGSTRNVHFVDFKGADELSEYYRTADIFVLPTREDVWGLVINEAMAYGLPVITTNNCGAGVELINTGSEGIIINSEDVETLTDAIIELYKDEEKRKFMSKNALKKIQKYTIEEMVLQHVKYLSI